MLLSVNIRIKGEQLQFCVRTFDCCERNFFAIMRKAAGTTKKTTKRKNSPFHWVSGWLVCTQIWGQKNTGGTVSWFTRRARTKMWIPYSFDRLALRGGDAAGSSSLPLPLSLPLPEPDSEPLTNIIEIRNWKINARELAWMKGCRRLKICRQLCSPHHFQNQSRRLQHPQRRLLLWLGPWHWHRNQNLHKKCWVKVEPSKHFKLIPSPSEAASESEVSSFSGRVSLRTSRLIFFAMIQLIRGCNAHISTLN